MPPATDFFHVNDIIQFKTKEEIKELLQTGAIRYSDKDITKLIYYASLPATIVSLFQCSHHRCLEIGIVDPLSPDSRIRIDAIVFWSPKEFRSKT